MLLYWLFFRVIFRHGEFADYARFASQLELLPENLCRRNASSIPERIALPRNTMTATI
ncbi:glucosamine--fructose-6-phosphate aminotransferase [Klebsiella pneumoniae]|uniref:Glucosamine--fructose-6-phosphate aminotransferase n=1 Tax=Klebsiella pneumoniae TaxID=573 RepID=A0A2X3ITM5_KLEPN|nr:glucosamine--fructose-6-phosphate aminotransferase [Klebsiella pneumoniae]